MTRPEQSKPDGLAPPYTYGTPRYCSAICTALPPSELAGGAETVDSSRLPPPDDVVVVFVVVGVWAACAGLRPLCSGAAPGRAESRAISSRIATLKFALYALATSRLRIAAVRAWRELTSCC